MPSPYSVTPSLSPHLLSLSPPFKPTHTAAFHLRNRRFAASPLNWAHTLKHEDMMKGFTEAFEQEEGKKKKMLWNLLPMTDLEVSKLETVLTEIPDE